MEEAEKMLNEAFGKVGRTYGYESVTAKFSEFKDFKVKWRRSCGWAEFEVTDYIRDAPQNIKEEMAEMIFTMISRQTRKDYPQDLLAWISSSEFVRKNRPTFLARSKNLTQTRAGEHLDLGESYERLIEAGLVKEDKDVMIVWTKRPNVKRVGYCSILMSTVSVSSVLDTPDIPSFVADYVLYHELIHMKRGFDPFGQRHDLDFRALEQLHPMHEEAEEWLKRLRLIL